MEKERRKILIIDGGKEGRRSWIGKFLPELLEFYFNHYSECQLEITSADGPDNAKKILAGGDEFDYVVFSAEYQAELLELVLRNQPGASIIVVHDWKGKLRFEWCYWLNGVLNLFEWTDFKTLKGLLDGCESGVLEARPTMMTMPA